MKENSFKWMMVTSIIASIIASVADVFILYSPNGGYHTLDYQFLKDVPYQRLVIGHFMGIFAIPAYLLGFWWVSKALEPAGAKIPGRAFGISIFILILGVSYHASVGLMWLLANAESPELIDQGRIFFEPTGNLIAVCLVIFSSWLGIWVVKGKTLFPKSMIWFLPIFPYLIFIGCYLLIPAIGNVLIVAGFNIAIGLFLLGAYFALKDNRQLFV